MQKKCFIIFFTFQCCNPHPVFKGPPRAGSNNLDVPGSYLVNCELVAAIMLSFPMQSGQNDAKMRCEG